jgi:hypothetical protein
MYIIMNVTSILAFVVGKSLMSTWRQAAQSSSCLKVERVPSNPCAANVLRGSQSREVFEAPRNLSCESWLGRLTVRHRLITLKSRNHKRKILLSARKRTQSMSPNTRCVIPYVSDGVNIPPGASTTHAQAVGNRSLLVPQEKTCHPQGWQGHSITSEWLLCVEEIGEGLCVRRSHASHVIPARSRVQAGIGTE